jgi:hypothetical protein
MLKVVVLKGRGFSRQQVYCYRAALAAEGIFPNRVGLFQKPLRAVNVLERFRLTLL